MWLSVDNKERQKTYQENGNTKKGSNIISFVDAAQLKKENMDSLIIYL